MFTIDPYTRANLVYSLIGGKSDNKNDFIAPHDFWHLSASSPEKATAITFAFYLLHFKSQHLAARSHHHHIHARLKSDGLHLQQTVYMERFLIDWNSHQRFNLCVCVCWLVGWCEYVPGRMLVNEFANDVQWL